MFRNKRGDGTGLAASDARIIIDYLIGIAQKLAQLTKTLEDMQKTLDMLHEARPDKDITDGLSEIMNFNGRGKSNDA